ncbi:MAG: Fe-S cluster assembly sulfur transfer protein SufU [Kiloniellales bacterium]
MLDDLRELYQEVILDHGKNPRNHRHPAEANKHAHGYNPMCGDTVTVHLTVDPEGTIRDVAFEGKGCAISMASASLMTETLKGRSAAEARALFQKFQRLCTSDEVELSEVDDDALERLQVLSGVRAFPMRVKCATLAWHTLNAALEGRDETSTE